VSVRESRMKTGSNQRTEKSPIRRLLSRGNTSPFPQLLAFFPLRSTRHTPPPDWLSQTHPCFHSRGVGSVRRTSHPSGSRLLDVSLLRQTSAPGIVDAPENPRFPAVSNRVQRPDRMAPSRVQLLQGARQRRRTTRPCGGRPSVMG
jgi:hypothetical protein